MILEAPAIVRASNLDALSPTLKYTKRAIIVDKLANFLGFAQYRQDQFPYVYHFEAFGEMEAAGLKLAEIPEIGWLTNGPIRLWKKDTLHIELTGPGAPI